MLVYAQCTNAPYEQWPLETFTPVCSSIDETITFSGFAGEYSLVNVTTGTMYTFKSNLSTDYLTITSADASTSFAWGVTPVTWTSTTTGTIRFFTHTAAGCEYNEDIRLRIIQCGAPLLPPANDDCANALTVVSGAMCVPIAGSTAGATESLPGCTGNANDDVWYKFIATSSSHTITVTGIGGFDAVIDVRSGSCNGTSIDCVDNSGTNSTEVSNLTGLIIGNVYLIRVYHFFTAASAGTFTICVTTSDAALPENDLCADAISLDCGDTVMGITVGSTFDDAGFCVTGNSSPGVWYTFAGTGEDVTASLCGSGYDTKISVFTGSCGMFTCVTGNDDNDICGDGAFSNQSLATFQSIMGTTYYILVHGFSQATGTFTLAVTCSEPPPPLTNDLCADAISLECGDTVMGTTVGSSFDDAGFCDTENSSPGVWYSFDGTGEDVTASLCGSAYDTKISVYSGSCGAFTCVAGNDDNSACAGGGFSVQSQVFFKSAMGITYYILVHGIDNEVGVFTLVLTCSDPPPTLTNDDCAGAITLTPGDTCGPVSGTTLGATESLPGIDCGLFIGSDANDDVWYQFTATTTSHTVIVTGIGDFDAVVDIRSGACDGTSITCANATFNGGTEEVNISGLMVGEVYLIRVYDYFSTPGGNFTICVTFPPPPPANDNCAGAIAFPTIPIDGTCASVVANTQNATGTEDAQCTGTEDDDIWYSFTVPLGFTQIAYAMTNISGNTDRVLQIYSGICPGTHLSCHDPESGTISGLTGGATYLMRAYTWSSGVTSNFNICLSVIPPPPANDLCSGAISISCGQTVSGSTTFATADVASFCITGDGTGGGVWYSFLGDGTTVTLSLCNAGTNFNTKLRVYSGTCGSLTCVAGNDDAGSLACPLSSTRSIATFNSVIGTTYYILVHGFSTAVGNFELTVTCIPPCTAPGIPVASNVTHNSATLSWPSAMGATRYRYSNGSGAHVCGTGSLSRPSRSVNLVGLVPNTTYTFCVRTDACGGGQTSSYVSTTFTTEPPCGIPLDFPWSLYNIGGSTGSGLDNEQQCAGTIELSSSGYGTVTGPDKHTFAGQCFCGDGSIKAKLESVTNLGWGGIIFRATSDAGSMKVGMRTQLSNVFMRDFRTTTNGLAQQASLVRPTNPMWMRITRTGNNFVGQTSVNGTSWAFAFTVTIPNMPMCIEAGLYTQSINNNVTATATFSNVMLMGDQCYGEPYDPLHSDQNLTNRTVRAAMDYSLYPNPANDVLNIQWNEAFIGKAADITVVNQIGQVVHSLKIPAIDSDTETLQIDNLSDGLYIISVRSGDAQVLHRKFMVHSIRP